MRALAPTLAGLLAVALLPGCRHLVWYGRGPTRRATVEVWERAGRQYVVWNGMRQRAFRAIGLRGLTVGPRGRHLAYPARRKDGWVVVRDGRSGAVWRGVGTLRFGPHGQRLAAVVRDAAGWRVVVDGRAGPLHTTVLRGTLRFSPDGHRVAWAARRQGRVRVFVQGHPGPAFHGVSQLRLARGSRVAYVGRQRSHVRAVIDGRLGPRYDEIRELGFSPDGRRVGYLARRGRVWVAVVDAHTSRPFVGARGLVFSPDGKQVAFAAQDGVRARVVKNGTEGPLHDGVRYETLAFDGAGMLLYVARTGRRYRVVHAGQVGPAYDRVRRPVVSGRRWGYLARRGRLRWLVMKGERHRLPAGSTGASDLRLPARSRRWALILRRGRRRAVVSDRGARWLDLVVEDTLTFDDQGRRWGCLAGDRRSRTLFISIEGQGRRPFDTEELTALVMKRRAVSAATLRRWVRAEVERSLSGDAPTRARRSPGPR